MKITYSRHRCKQTKVGSFCLRVLNSDGLQRVSVCFVFGQL